MNKRGISIINNIVVIGFFIVVMVILLIIIGKTVSNSIGGP